MSRAPLRLVPNVPVVKDFPHDPARRGYSVTYRSGETNRCPGCGRSHWYVGRLMAECAFCGTALTICKGTI